MSLVQRLALNLEIPDHNGLMQMPYDKFCPKVRDLIGGRTCVCGIYFPSVAAMRRHKKVAHPKEVTKESEDVTPRDEHLEEDEDADDNNVSVFIENRPDQMPVYRDIFSVMKSPWTEADIL